MVSLSNKATSFKVTKLPEGSIFSLEMNYNQVYNAALLKKDESYDFSNEEREFVISKLLDQFPDRTFEKKPSKNGDIYFQETTKGKIVCNFYHSIFPFIRCPKKEDCISKVPTDIFQKTESVIKFTL